MLAGGNRLPGAADDLVVAPHRLPRRDRPHRQLVAGRDQAADRDAFTVQDGASDQLVAGDHDIVCRVDADDRAVRG
jgi:hypothetical protein